jgi:hypothetical protein
MTDELAFMDAMDQAHLVVLGKITPLELVEAATTRRLCLVAQPADE